MTFSERVVALALVIPAGQVTTYGDLARAAGGGPLAARSITSILSKFPNHQAIPWHRIVYANGRVWLSDGQETKRRKLYQQEDIQLDDRGHIIDFAEIRCDFSELQTLI